MAIGYVLRTYRLLLFVRQLSAEIFEQIGAATVCCVARALRHRLLAK